MEKKNRLHNVSGEGNRASCSVCEGGATIAKRNCHLTRKPGDLITASRKSKVIK